MPLTDAEIAGFEAELREIVQMDASGREEIEAALSQAARQLQVFERRLNANQGLSAYDRRVEQGKLEKLAFDLAYVRRQKLPRKVFRFASRKFLSTEQEVGQAEAEGVTYLSHALIQNLHGTAQIVNTPELRNEDLLIKGCKSSMIVVTVPLAAIYIDDCNECTIFCGIVGGALHTERCKEITVVGACHQLRIHDATGCSFFLVLGSDPIIERSKGLSFVRMNDPSTLNGYRDLFDSLYDGWTDELLESSPMAAFTVKDFTWLKTGQNPHYAWVDIDDQSFSTLLEGLLHSLENVTVGCATPT
ncbi:Tubulin specific chaperone D [Giardia muris]|uniref:Tubulin specific chaperone D n=1 Tax=Giardia muris TaxID=5742 RepID=A0A4Z1T5H8_GIAMU|nr:Tubulin specific chaperone D [Giardia muris]|eukprot:TNJ27779.1 Tubulin specific chaperone D [Giardia muris]